MATSDGTYVITGAKGGLKPRLEIRELQANHPEQFTLFILAFLKVRDANYEPAAARFVELAGIHGLPYEKWPGDPNGKSEGHPGEDGQWGGYCHHGSVLFPIWHRPYVLALEQSISEAAHAIAKEFEQLYPAEAARWLDAAASLRFPFWDWTLPSTGTEGLPKVLQPGQLELIMPGAGLTKTSVDNILAYYSFGNAKLPEGFRDVDESGNPLLPPGTKATAYFSKWDRTYRWPQSTPNQPTEDYQQIQNILTGKTTNPRGGYKDLMNNVANLFAFDSTAPGESWNAYIWDNFSNTTFETEGLAPLPSVAGSIEHPHNSVHLVLGGIGAMGDNDYAGFDPIFFLHHANVDRIFAFWEYVYPNYWMGQGFINKDGKLQPFTDEEGTWSENTNFKVTEDNVLDPFRKDFSNYWVAKETRFMGNLSMGYTYPPLAGVQVDKPATPEQRAQYLGDLQRHFTMNPHQVRDATVALKPAIFADDATEKLPVGYVAVKGFRHFVLRAELQEYAFNSSYSLEFLYKNSAGVVVPVGAVPVLGRGSNTRCAACVARRARGNVIKGVVTIDTDIVADIVTKENLNDDEATTEQIIEALKRNIYAALQTPSGGLIASARQGAVAGGTPLPATQAPKITILSANVAHPKDAGEHGALSYYDIAQHGQHLTEEQWQRS